MNQREVVLDKISKGHGLLVKKASASLDRNRALFKENEQIVEDVFDTCQGLWLENGKDTTKLKIDNDTFKIMRRDYTVNGEIIERYYIGDSKDDVYAEVTKDGVFINEVSTEKTTSHEHKLRNSRKIQDIVEAFGVRQAPTWLMASVIIR